MFNSIKGVITAKLPKQLFLENNGIEWDICMPDSNLELIGNVGSEVKVYTYLQHTDMLMNLFGFSSDNERKLFLDLLKVDGVGPKAAIKIMSCVSSSRLISLLENSDVEMLEKIPGIGKKTAGKILLSLKGKLSISEDSSVNSNAIKPNSKYNDVINSLVSMGYEKRTVEQKIYELAGNLCKDENFTKLGQKSQEEFLFKKAIVELS